MEWKGSTVRLDLRKVGSVVLIRHKNHWEPFKIMSYDTPNRRVEGVLILTDEVVKLSGDIPTHKITNKWINIYLEWMYEEDSKIKNRIEILKELKE